MDCNGIADCIGTNVDCVGCTGIADCTGTDVDCMGCIGIADCTVADVDCTDINADDFVFFLNLSSKELSVESYTAVHGFLHGFLYIRCNIKYTLCVFISVIHIFLRSSIHVNMLQYLVD